MNKTIGKWLLGATLGSALLVSAAGWAMGPGGGMDRDPAQMVERMSSKLDLSEEQQAQVEQLLTSGQQESAADRERLPQLREQMRAQSNNFEAGKAQAIADEIGQISGRMVYQAAETQAGIYQLLNDEQKAQMDKMMEKRHSFRDKRHAGGSRDSQ